LSGAALLLVALNPLPLLALLLVALNPLPLLQGASSTLLLLGILLQTENFS